MRRILVPNIFTADGSRTRVQTSTGKIYGFAVGAQSHHPELAVSIAGTDHRIAIGAPLLFPCGLAADQVAATFGPVRPVAHQVLADYGSGHRLESFESQAELLVLECPTELGAQLPTKMGAIQESVEFDATSAHKNVWIVPFAGRERAVFYTKAEYSDDLTIFGAHLARTALGTAYADPGEDLFTGFLPGDYPAVVAQVTCSGSFAKVVENENFDVLVLALGPAVSAAWTASVELEVR